MDIDVGQSIYTEYKVGATNIVMAGDGVEITFMYTKNRECDRVLVNAVTQPGLFNEVVRGKSGNVVSISLDKRAFTDWFIQTKLQVFNATEGDKIKAREKYEAICEYYGIEPRRVFYTTEIGENKPEYLTLSEIEI